jgi:hypothetical protein
MPFVKIIMTTSGNDNQRAAHGITGQYETVNGGKKSETTLKPRGLKIETPGAGRPLGVSCLLRKLVVVGLIEDYKGAIYEALCQTLFYLLLASKDTNPRPPTNH